MPVILANLYRTKLKKEKKIASVEGVAIFGIENKLPVRATLRERNVTL